MESLEKKSSKKRQYLSIFLCWLAYTSVYFGRYSYSANIALVEEDYGVSHASAGLVMTLFAAAYGMGQLVHGIMCKYYPRRIIVPFALIVAGTMNVLVFCGIPFFMIKYLWLISGMCQSILWPMTMQVLSENVGSRLMKYGILAMSTTTSLGTFLIYGMSAVFSETNYRLTFLVGALIVFASAAVWFVLYKPGPYFRIKFKEHNQTEAKKTGKIAKSLLASMILLAIFSIITNFAKDGLQTWVPVIFKSLHGMPDSYSMLLTLVLPIFGIFGATLAVALNKKVPKLISLTLIFWGTAALFNFIVLEFKDNLFITVFAFGVLELLLHGLSNIIVSIFPLSMREKMSTGAIAGILNGCGYIGSAASSYALGKIADVSGWTTVFVTLLVSVCVAVISGIIYKLISIKNKDLEF